MVDWKNKLYFGDNLDILREHVPDESVDLVYLDPPFNSNATYNVLFKEASGEGSAAQIHAFDDTWHWSMESERAYREVVTDGPKKLADLLQAMRSFLGQERHDGLPHDDGAAHGRTAPRAQADRQHLPPLRPDGQSLPQVADGRGVGLQVGTFGMSHLEAHKRSGPTPKATEFSDHDPLCSTTSASH